MEHQRSRRFSYSNQPSVQTHKQTDHDKEARRWELRRERGRVEIRPHGDLARPPQYRFALTNQVGFVWLGMQNTTGVRTGSKPTLIGRNANQYANNKSFLRLPWLRRVTSSNTERKKGHGSRIPSTNEPTNPSTISRCEKKFINFGNPLRLNGFQISGSGNAPPLFLPQGLVDGEGKGKDSQ